MKLCKNHLKKYASNILYFSLNKIHIFVDKKIDLYFLNNISNKTVISVHNFYILMFLQILCLHDLFNYFIK